MKDLEILTEKGKAIFGKRTKFCCLPNPLFLFPLLYLVSFSTYAEVKEEVQIIISSDIPNGVNRTEISIVNHQEERVSQKLLIEYLIEKELINDTKNYKLKLTNQFTSINGRKQSREIHEYVLKNFVKNPDEHLEVTITISTD